MNKILSKATHLITKPEHIFYLTKFNGEGFVILRNNSILLATDQRYWLLAKKIKKKGVKLLDLKEGWKEELQKQLSKVRTVYFEDDHLTVAQLAKWKKILPKKKWKNNDGELKKLRLIKSQDELEKLRMAAHLGDEVLKKVKAKLRPGVTEKKIAMFIMQQANELADGISFEPIVAFGKNGAVPHHHSGNTRLKKNDAVLVDQGVKHKGYMSDMTRCFFVGKGIPKVRAMYDHLLEVQKAAVNMVRPGVKIKDLAIAVRALLGEEAKYFTHSLGHGVGLEIHEDPKLSRKSDEVLEEGMVITIEPGIYIPGVGGVRIEDTLIVTEEGNEVITRSSK